MHGWPTDTCEVHDQEEEQQQHEHDVDGSHGWCAHVPEFEGGIELWLDPVISREWRVEGVGTQKEALQGSFLRQA